MGCGCNKKTGQISPRAGGKATVYQVVGSDQSVLDEFSSLGEARSRAIEVSGRVRVTSR